MIKKITIFLVILFLVTALLQAQVKGRAMVSSTASFPDGLFATSDTFPKDTLIEILNTENNSRSKAVIIGKSGNQSVLLTVSSALAQALNIKPGTAVQIQVTIPPHVPEEGADPSLSLQNRNSRQPSLAYNPAPKPAEPVRQPYFVDTPVSPRESQKPESEPTYTPVPQTKLPDPPEHAPPYSVGIPMIPNEKRPPQTVAKTEQRQPPLDEPKPVNTAAPIVMPKHSINGSDADPVSIVPRPNDKPPEIPLQNKSVPEAAPIAKKQEHSKDIHAPKEIPVSVKKPEPPVEEPKTKEVAEPETEDTYQQYALVPTAPREPVGQKKSVDSGLIFDMDKQKTPKSGNKNKKKEGKNILKKGKYYVQVGCFSKSEYVDSFMKQYKKSYPVLVEEKSTEKNRQYRVYVGPLKNDERGAVLETFKAYGFTDAFLKKGL